MSAARTGLSRQSGVVAWNPFRINGIARRLVFRGAQQVFTHNRNKINAFGAELVFRDVPGEFIQWGRDAQGLGVGSGPGVASIDAVASRVAGVSPPPVSLCLLAADSLALRLTATPLAVAYPWIRIEPSQTVPAGALPRSGHPPLSARSSGGQLFAGMGGPIFVSAEARFRAYSRNTRICMGSVC